MSHLPNPTTPLDIPPQPSSPTTPFPQPSSTLKNMDVFFAEITTINSLMKRVGDNVTIIKKLQDQSLNVDAVSGGRGERSDTEIQLDGFSEENRTVMNSVKNRIKGATRIWWYRLTFLPDWYCISRQDGKIPVLYLVLTLSLTTAIEQENAQLSLSHPEVNMRRSQHSQGKKKFLDLLTMYNEVEQEYSGKMKGRMERAMRVGKQCAKRYFYFPWLSSFLNIFPVIIMNIQQWIQTWRIWKSSKRWKSRLWKAAFLHSR